MNPQIDIKSVLYGVAIGVLGVFAIGAATSSNEIGKYQFQQDRVVVLSLIQKLVKLGVLSRQHHSIQNGRKLLGSEVSDFSKDCLFTQTIFVSRNWVTAVVQAQVYAQGPNVAAVGLWLAAGTSSRVFSVTVNAGPPAPVADAETWGRSNGRSLTQRAKLVKVA